MPKLKPGTWTVPVRWDLLQDPQVRDLAEELGCSAAQAMGCLVALWGHLSYHARTLDEPFQISRKADRAAVVRRVDDLVGVPGFALAAESVCRPGGSAWLVMTNDGTVHCPGVERYMVTRDQYEDQVGARREAERQRKAAQRERERGQDPGRGSRGTPPGRHAGQFEESLSEATGGDVTRDNPVTSRVTSRGCLLPLPLPLSELGEGRAVDQLRTQLAHMLPTLGQYLGRRQVSLPGRLLQHPRILLAAERTMEVLDAEEGRARPSKVQAWLDETTRLLVQGKPERALHAWEQARIRGWRAPGFTHRGTDDAVAAAQSDKAPLLPDEQQAIEQLQAAIEQHLDGAARTDPGPAAGPEF